MRVTEEWEVLVDPQPKKIYCSLALRNIGAGTAFIRGMGLRAQGVSWSGIISSTVVPPKELTRMSFAIPRDRPELEPLLEDVPKGSFSVEVAYTDMNGRQISKVRAIVFHSTQDRMPHVRQVFTYASKRRGSKWPREKDWVQVAASGPAD